MDQRSIRCRKPAWRLLAGAILCIAAGARTATAVDEDSFHREIRPLLERCCLDCHVGDDAEAGIRLERLTGAFESDTLRLWDGVRRQIADGAMPPDDAAQPSAAEREKLLQWIEQGLQEARSRPDPRNGLVRRLTAAQYRNTLRDLLGLREQVAETLPPDGVSKDGFTNNVQSLMLSPLQVEAYLNIAEKALDRCFVDVTQRPAVQCFRMELGQGINGSPEPDELILGALSSLLGNSDFVVTEPGLQKPFDFDPAPMRTSWRFIEGYEGNETVRGWREYDSIYHSVFACVRGAPGYPRGQAWEMVPSGLLLRPSITENEQFQVGNTYGPLANFKVALRELPDGGRFRVTVRAARYNDGLLLDEEAEAAVASDEPSVLVDDPATVPAVHIDQAGIYQVDVYCDEISNTSDGPPLLKLVLGERFFSGVPPEPVFLVVRLPAGPLSISAEARGATLQRIQLTRLADSSDLAGRFRTFEQRTPHLGVHVGLRRDCGSTLAPVGGTQAVDSAEPAEFIFEDAIRNYPSPEVEPDNVNYLAGIREIAVRSEFTDGREMPRLLLRSVQFEGPYYKTWPPETHRRILVESELPAESPEYARLVIRRFAQRAFRRPVTAEEEEALVAVWRDMYQETGSFLQAVKYALRVVLTSPQFLFLVERSETPAPERLDDFELASKLSYFLWNTAPDRQLLDLAAAGQLHSSRVSQVERMMADQRFSQATEQFVSEWLDLRRFDVVEVDRKQFSKLTRDTRLQLRKEPVKFVEYLIRHNLSVTNLLQSDMIMANEAVAAYYGLADRLESGFEFVPVQHQTPELGGVLTQAGVLSGLSDGQQPNPIKRGAWLARRIIFEPPADPPPNVPDLPEDNEHLPLRERLEQHRSRKGCADCHAGIDPWGLPFEQYDAGGLWREEIVDCRSTLPDGTIVSSAKELRSYLADERIHQVAFSFLRHVATYAVGRSLTWNEIEFLREHALELQPEEMRMRDLIQFVVASDLFLMK